ncbi:MAG TPA: Mur ligase family protein [Acidimicrobiia bacterium]
MSPEEARAWLEAHVSVEAGARVSGRGQRLVAIDRMWPLVELLGSPQLEYPAVHLTGTNGKTSTARMTTALLMAAGLSTGAYTSPHLQRVNERMSWNDQPIDDETLADQLTAVAAVEDFLPDRPSHFEILTAAALRWFSDVAVDVAVVEVGLGGSGDATNVVDGRVAVVTNVSVDHVDYIGPTVHDIASEKAGIVKPGSVLVLGETDPALAAPFLEREAERVVARDVDFGVTENALAVGGRVVGLFTPSAEYHGVYMPLHGSHQADNAAVALTAAECFLGGALEHDTVVSAFAAVRSPGRLEVVGRRPLVLLDGAHNVAGAIALRDALAEEFAGSERTLVVGLLRQKDPREMLAALGAVDATRLVCCRPPSDRAIAPDELAAAALELGIARDAIDVIDGIDAALARAFATTSEEGQIVVTGTLYLVGAARALLVSPDDSTSF